MGNRLNRVVANQRDTKPRISKYAAKVAQRRARELALPDTVRPSPVVENHPVVDAVSWHQGVVRQFLSTLYGTVAIGGREYPFTKNALRNSRLPHRIGTGSPVEVTLARDKVSNQVSVHRFR